MYEDDVLGLEDEHEVEGSADTEGHAIGKGSMSDRIGEEDSRKGHDDPGTHTEAVRELSLAAHVGRTINW